jgi:phosphatidylglycerol:prolipoprotein diacylglycerol transferase
MHPVIHHIWGPFAVYSYGLCMAAAIFTGLAAFYLRARFVIESKDKIVSLALVIVVTALVGSWVLFVLSNLDYYASLPWKEVELWGSTFKVPPVSEYAGGGMVFYGGVLGALGGGLTYGLLARIPILDTMDCFGPAVALGHAWGRVGCFLAGCCYGRPCDGLETLCARFPEGSVAFADLSARGIVAPGAESTPPLIPVQLMESGFELVLAMVLMHVYGWRPRRGQVMSAYFILYGAFRFLMEYLRFDPYRGSFLFFSVSQWVSLGLIVAGAVLIAATQAGGARNAGKGRGSEGGGIRDFP